MTAISAILKYVELNNQNYPLDQNTEIPERPKKRRLDHLTWEEKIQRKKLKNRVAAQTSRDRKKAKMDQMENALQQLFSKNESLIAECENLKLANQRLSQENLDLYNRLQSPCPICANSQNRSVECEALNGPTESLLLQKGRVTHSAAVLKEVRQMSQPALRKIVQCYLLYQTFLMNLMQMSTSTRWNNLPRVYYKISPETCKQVLRKQIIRNHKILNPVHVKWWGRHQKNWNPVDVKF
nr:X-box-binding protein 1 isoform X1 [Leptinotarsa decemlineata]